MGREVAGLVSQFWAQGLEDLFATVDSSPDGLSTQEARRRLDQSGPNALRPSKKSGAFTVLASQFKGPTTVLLIGAAVLSGFLGNASDAAIILTIVVASGLLSFRHEYVANRAVQDLIRLVAARVTVLRDGKETEVLVEQIVQGDVQLIGAGSLIAGDGVVLSSNDLLVNQAALTGEPFPIEKSAGKAAIDVSPTSAANTVFKGTFATSGTGRVLIVQTGRETLFGDIAERIRSEGAEGTFHRGVREYGTFLVQLSLVLTLFVFGVNVWFHRPVLESFLFSVALAVGLTPQLLPAIMSVTLARGAHHLARAEVVAKRLEAIEDFGAMDVLCSDKTGTLTEGTVSVRSAVGVDGKESQEVLRLAVFTAMGHSGLANPIDQFLLSYINLAGSVQVLFDIPYDFTRKRLSVVVRPDSELLLVTKGALESVLDVCTLSKDGRPILDVRKETLQRLEAWGQQGLRVLGVASRRIGSTPPSVESERQMVFEGCLLVEDPLRADGPDTVARLRSQGVHLKILTGDNRYVASSVGNAVGLRTSRVLIGQDVRRRNDRELRQAIRGVDVFAELDPVDKERLLVALHSVGHTVGYLGDGINDGPALRAANVGISVSNAVDVAREAADFIMLKPGLGILCDAVAEGRQIFANTLKYVFITTSASFGNMFSMAAASLLLPFLPLLPKQILLTNFLTDIPAFAVSGDAVEPETVRRPRRWHLRSLRDFMLVFGLVSSVFDLLTFVVLLLLLNASRDLFRTGWFVESVVSEILILLVLRTRRPLFKSRPGRILLWSSLAVAGVSLAMPYLWFGPDLGLVPLPPTYLFALTLVLALYGTASEIAKRWFFKRHGKI